MLSQTVGRAIAHTISRTLVRTAGKPKSVEIGYSRSLPPGRDFTERPRSLPMPTGGDALQPGASAIGCSTFGAFLFRSRIAFSFVLGLYETQGAVLRTIGLYESCCRTTIVDRDRRAKGALRRPIIHIASIRGGACSACPRRLRLPRRGCWLAFPYVYL